MTQPVQLTAVIDSRPKACAFSFSMPSGPVLTIMPEGRLVRGEGFASDDEASVAFLDCLSRHLPGFISELRQRAERAEAELAALKARTA